MHFFIDHQQLPAQTLEQSFGPNNGTSSTQYNVTSKFQLSASSYPARAFACEDALMIVQNQTGSTSLVNIILKPLGYLSIPLSVKYYIYRGVLKSSLINGTNIAPNTNCNELIARIWNQNPADKGRETLGYNESLAGNKDVEDIFRYYLINYAKPIKVKHGEWIGNFTRQSGEEIGFEIILDSDEVKIDLDYLRADKQAISTSSLTDSFDIKCQREKILNYIDPSAFLGMHYDSVISVSTYNGTTKTTNKVNPSEIYSTLLNGKFYTANKLYIDVKSEKGFSYNFYGNYGTNNAEIQLYNNANGNADGKGTYLTQGYNTYSWPIIIFDSPQNTTSTKKTNKLNLKLRVNNNLKPLVFLVNKNRKAIESERLSNYIIQAKSEVLSAGWGFEIKLELPNSGNGLSKPYLANYIKIYYFKQIDSNNANAIELKNKKYYDSAFCSIDLWNLGNPNTLNQHVKGAHLSFIREKLNDDGTGNFGFVADCGAYWDNQRILFYATRLKFESGNSDFSNSGKKYVNTYRHVNNFINNKKFNKSKLRKNTDIICREYRTVDDGTKKIIGINGYKIDGIYSKKEDALFLGLTIDEITSIKNTTGLTDKHPRFIFLEQVGNTPLIETASGNLPRHRYYKYQVKLQGISNITKNPSLVIPKLTSSENIYVYSRDNQFFHSIGYGTNAIIGPGTSKEIEYHIYSDGVIKINDNIDLSLVRKKIVNPNYEISDDAQIGDESSYQKIFYRYRPSNNTFATQIVAFNLISINEVLNSNQNVPFGLPNNDFLGPAYLDYQNIILNGGIWNEYKLAGRGANGGVNAYQAFQNHNNHIAVYGNYTAHPIRRYNKTGKIRFLVYFDNSIVNRNSFINPSANNNHKITYKGTLRFYCNPDFSSIVLGALMHLPLNVITAGLAFADGTCYPSTSHTNGIAIDTAYFYNNDETINLEQNTSVVDAFIRFGITHFIVGDDDKFNSLFNYINQVSVASRDRGHDDHMHIGGRYKDQIYYNLIDGGKYL